MEQDYKPLTLREIVVFFKHILIPLIICTVLGAVIATGIVQIINAKKPTSYIATARLVLEIPYNQDYSSYPEFGQQITRTYGVKLTSDQVLESIIKDLNLDSSLSALRETIKTNTDSQLLQIEVTVQNPNSEQALKILERLVFYSDEIWSETLMGEALVVSQPSVSVFSTPINRTRTALIGALIGFALCIIIVLVYRSLYQTIRSSDDIKNVSNYPIIGVIPHNKKQQPLAAVSQKGTSGENALNGLYSSDSIEAFHRLRTNLEFCAENLPIKGIIVSSAGSEEGKSSVAIGLAATLAADSKKVLLVDCNFRKPSLNHFLRLKNDFDFDSSFIDNPIAIDDCIHTIHNEDSIFHVLSTDRPLDNPSEFIGSEKMTAFLEVLFSRYEYIIFDTPPAVPYTDAAVLSRYISNVLLVVKQRKTTTSQLKEVLSTFHQVDASILGIILNDYSKKYDPN